MPENACGCFLRIVPASNPKALRTLISDLGRTANSFYPERSHGTVLHTLFTCNAFIHINFRGLKPLLCQCSYRTHPDRWTGVVLWTSVFINFYRHIVTSLNNFILIIYPVWVYNNIIKAKFQLLTFFSLWYNLYQVTKIAYID